MHHCPNSSLVPLIRPALMLLSIEVFDIPTARAACPPIRYAPLPVLVRVTFAAEWLMAD
jgi:hypothetical protein